MEKYNLMLQNNLIESNRHGNILFPINSYDWWGSGKDNTILECHRHEECEFFMVTEGSTYLKIDGQKFLITVGEVIFINSNAIHLAEAFENQFCRYKSIVFHPSILYGPTRDIIQIKYIHPLLKNQMIINKPSSFDRKGNEFEIFNKLHTTLIEKKLCLK